MDLNLSEQFYASFLNLNILNRAQRYNK